MKNTLLVLFFSFLLVINFTLAQSDCSGIIRGIERVKFELNGFELNGKVVKDSWLTMGHHLLVQLQKSSCNNSQTKEVLIELDKEIRMAYGKRNEKFVLSEIQKHIDMALLMADKAIKTLEPNDTNTDDQTERINK